MIFLLLSIACKTAEPTADGPAPTTPASDTATTVPTGDTAISSTGTTADTAPELPVFDCDNVPAQVVSTQEITGPTGYHDLAFTPDGRVIGASRQNSDLLVGDYTGGVGVLSPQVGLVEQMVWLPDGDLAVASYEEGIIRVAPNGARSPIQPSIFAYGLILGPDAMLYAADQSRLLRIDPNTGNTEVLLEPDALERGSPRVIAFDLTFENLYIGTYGGSQGRIYSLPLDSTFTPTGPPVVWVKGVGSGGYHDSITVDVCGYLYIPDYDTKTLFRVTPNGTIVQALEKSPGLINSDYPHGTEFGNGVGGWREDALYMPMPYNQNKVRELVVGVPSRDWPGTIINPPTW